MQSLLQAVLNRFKEWPADPGSDLYFSCDPDGEVRQQGQWGNMGCDLDFYPDVYVDLNDRGLCYGDRDGTLITEYAFKAAR